ncbi:MAG: ECF-type sigma factor, partial [Pseudomonadota bacterium]
SIDTKLENRGHFIGIVANLMRYILIDHARAKGSQKRGGDVDHVSLDDVTPASDDGPSVDLLALNSVLESLEKTQPRKVRIAELFYFCGTTY